VIHDVLSNELGYQTQWKVIDAKSWVPQHRERIFIVGFREPNEFRFEDMKLPDRLSGPKLKAILHEPGLPVEKDFTKPDGSADEKYTLSAHLWKYLKDYAEKHRLKGNGFGFGLFGPEDVARTLSARYYKDGSEILIRQKNRPPRRLTPRECARLMGFDSLGRSPMRIPVSDTQAYRQFGNAVVVPVVEAVATYLEPFILDAVNNRGEASVKAVA
jgi:DNA (cytosine-5)-methyltransferase 1